MARAITLVELLLAVSLISLVVLSAGALYTTATGFFTTFDTQAEMQNQANIALQDMIGNIYSAKDVERISDSEIEVIPITGAPFRYWQDGLYIRRGSISNSEIIACGVKELKFSEPAVNPDTQRKTLQIDLTMEGKKGLTDINFVTKITVRKYE